MTQARRLWGNVWDGAAEGRPPVSRKMTSMMRGAERPLSILFWGVNIFWLKRGVVLHDALHVFRVGQGMGTATLEANLNQWLYRKAHKPLSVFFINQQGV